MLQILWNTRLLDMVDIDLHLVNILLVRTIRNQFVWSWLGYHMRNAYIALLRLQWCSILVGTLRKVRYQESMFLMGIARKHLDLHLVELQDRRVCMNKLLLQILMKVDISNMHLNRQERKIQVRKPRIRLMCR